MNSEDKNLEKLLLSQKDLPYVSIADDVMSQIGDPTSQKRNGILVDMTRWFPKVAAACLLVIFAMLLKTYITEGNLDTDALMGISEMTIDEAYTFYE
ncbi:MAG: hypothetical protein AAF502_23160 [Bacteroidota bacterium]